MYIGQGRTIKTRIKEHQLHCKKGNAEKLVVAEFWSMQNPFVSKRQKYYTKAMIWRDYILNNNNNNWSNNAWVKKTATN